MNDKWASTSKSIGSTDLRSFSLGKLGLSEGSTSVAQHSLWAGLFAGGKGPSHGTFHVIFATDYLLKG